MADEVYFEFQTFEIEEGEAADKIHNADPAACIACGYKKNEGEGTGEILELKIINAVYPYPADYVKIRLCEGCRHELKIGIDAVAKK